MGKDLSCKHDEQENWCGCINVSQSRHWDKKESKSTQFYVCMHNSMH